MRKLIYINLMIFLTLSYASAHHNPVVYDGKRTVTLSGIVTSARFGYPHSRYAIDVSNADGLVEEWILMTEDPRDAKSLGFDVALKEIKVGDPITVVGWPNKIKAREIRGHQLHYADGTVVMMRRGNYIWTEDLKRIYRLRTGRDSFSADIGPVMASGSVAQVIAWIDEDDVVPRVAFEIAHGEPRLIGIDRGEGLKFPGVHELFACHTEREDFRLEIGFNGLDSSEQQLISNGDDFIRKFNNLLSRYWEYDIANC